jgi:hypothetical protein
MRKEGFRTKWSQLMLSFCSNTCLIKTQNTWIHYHIIQTVSCGPLVAEAHICVHVRFVVDKVALGQAFPSYLVFTCQYHSTVALHTHISSGGWTVGMLVAAVQRHNLTLLTWIWTSQESNQEGHTLVKYELKMFV